MTKNVTVTDETGRIIGTTYPRRARGLVKNGRALYVDDCTIRLSARAKPSDEKSEVRQMNYIFLNPREWSVGDAAQPSFAFSQGPFPQIGFPQEQVSAERTFINDFDGELVEVITLGGWNEQHAEVVSRVYRLTPDTEYSFVFWLNGGENDKSSETCLLKVDFSGGPGSIGYSNVYKLNRNYIKPKLHCQGWELYVIKFRTPGGVSEAEPVSDIGVRLTFVSGAAPMAVKPAREPDFYKDWKDEPDEFAAQRPQRHNIVFEDGWPSIHMYGGNKYSTEVLRRIYPAKGNAQGGTGGNPKSHVHRDGESGGLRELRKKITELDGRNVNLRQRLQELKAQYQELVLEDETEEDVEEKFDDVEDVLSGYPEGCFSRIKQLNQVIGELLKQAAEIPGRLQDVQGASDNGEDVLDRLGEVYDRFGEVQEQLDEAKEELAEVQEELGEAEEAFDEAEDVLDEIAHLLEEV